MKKLFLLMAFTMPALHAFANETFVVTDDKGNEICYETLDNPGEVSYKGAQCWSWDESYVPESVTVPATVTYEGKEYKVAEIGSYAFGHRNICSITLPDGLKTIAPQAFYASSITEISIPESVDSIGGGPFWGGAFARCEKLQKIKLPNIKVIAMQLFAQCTALAEVSIPDGVTTILGSAFEGCGSLKNVTLPESVTYIDDGAFYNCTALESVQLPSALTELGSLGYWTYGAGIFQGCTSLNNVTIPTGIKTIPYNCFYGCSSLSSIKLPDELEEIGYFAFCNCSSLETITIPNSVKKIGMKAFYGTAIKNVTLPFALEEISKDSFGDALEYLNIAENNISYTCIDGILYNKDVTELIIYPYGHGDSYTIPATVDNIDMHSLISLSNIYVEPGNKNFSCIDGVLFDKDATKLLLYPGSCPASYNTPSSVKEIGEYAFYNKNIEKIVMTEGLESIGSYAFYGATLNDASFPSTLEDIGECAFYSCSLSDITLSPSIQTIGSSAFAENSKLTSVKIGSTTARATAGTIIKSSAFSSCAAIKSIELGTCVKEIESYAFLYTYPSRIVLSEGLEKIGYMAFARMGDEYEYASDDFSLPSTLKEIEGSALMNIKFPKVTCYAATPPQLSGWKPIYGDILVVYDTAEQEYKASEWATSFNKIITMVDGINDINCDANNTNNIYYDLSGRRITNPSNGIYIKNGHKVIIRR